MSVTVLIVDDSKLARMAANKALQTLHPDWIRVDAASADEALEVIKQRLPDIALLDFNMPGQSGLDLAAEIRQTYPRMHVAVISANRQQEVLDRARTAGATFLPKPLTSDALAEFLEGALRDIRGAPS